jgi:diguanylate cyclase (GGDEF)-like protein
LETLKTHIEFISKLANILAKRISPSHTISDVNKLFKTYLNIEKIDFIIWDDNNFQLKDFICDWKIYDEKNTSNNFNFIFNNLSISKGRTFFFNEKEILCEITEKHITEININKEETNSIIFPLISSSEVFGMMNVTLTENGNYTKELFEVLNTASKLISGAIINYTLNEQMEVSLNFYKAMKDIAKIIESQYELSYIIPLIGEMIDRFMSAHLIYIFIYKEGEFKLVWPNACKDKQVYELIERVTPHTECVLSENSKIGAFPIINEEKILGAVVAYSNIEKLLQKDIDYLVQLTRQSGMTIQRANVYAEVLKHATMDALTGLNNRRQFEIRLNQELANAKRNNIALCCMMLDVDYFKKVNDTYGHSAGDEVLKLVSDVIKNEIREYDIACRFGGEEFFIILPQTNINEACSVAQRLRKVIEESKMEIKDAETEEVSRIKVTISVGVCEYEPSMTTDLIIQKADKALYEAKTTGRNRVIVG